MQADIISETFNRRMGDLALRSTDNVIFYIPRPILQYSSKVFEGMFEIGTPSADEKPILIQADANSLGLILTFAHPGLPNPTITTVSAMAKLLRIAKQYEMEGVTASLKMLFGSTITSAEMIKKEPLGALVVAHAFELHDIARLAMKEVVDCNFFEEVKAAKEYDLPIPLVGVISALRMAAAMRYKGALLAVFAIMMLVGQKNGTPGDPGKLSEWIYTAQLQVELIPTQKVYDEQIEAVKKHGWYTDEIRKVGTESISSQSWDYNQQLDDILAELNFTL